MQLKRHPYYHLISPGQYVVRPKREQYDMIPEKYETA